MSIYICDNILQTLLNLNLELESPSNEQTKNWATTIPQLVTLG
jgi:hypothetical protein